MTASAPQHLSLGSRWRQFLRTCPIWLTLWTRHGDVSIAGTYFRDMSISTSFLDARPLAAAPREQVAQAAKLDRLVWANLEDIDYGG